MTDFRRLRALLARANESRTRLATCLLVSALVAGLVSALLGDSFDHLAQPARGAPRNRLKRQAEAAAGVPATPGNESAGRDPFASRPRILTRNGHLTIESSQDKNIEFRTGGARGSILLNGHKLDQLLGVVRALERMPSEAGGGGGGGDGGASSAPEALVALAGKPSLDAKYELVLGNLVGAGQRLRAFERAQKELSGQLGELSKQLGKLARRQAKTAGQQNKLTKQLETLLGKLKQNNCLDPNSGQPVCKNGATCVDAYDSFKCLCPAEFEGPTCELDVDECQRFRGTDLGCQNGARCVNFAGGYRCECPARYHGVHCTSVHDDCALSSSAALCGHGKCVNLARTVPDRPNFECVCDQGWASAGPQAPACVVDVNECLAGQLQQQQQFGPASLGNLSSLAAPTNQAYPCSLSPFVECVNLPGSFQCGPCPSGYAGNGRTCRDVDECDQANGGCSQNPPVECINLPGTRRCGPCPPGFVGDGLVCTRTSACQAQPNGGCHPQARCVELSGLANGAADLARICICQYPFVGPGVGPAGCAPIAAGAGAGPTSAGAQQQPARPRDDCNPSPCLNGASCQLGAAGGDFECACAAGWSGSLCDQRADLSCGGRFHAPSAGLFQFPVGGSHESLVRQAAARQPATQTERHYECVWSIETASNMSLKLSFSQLTNKLDPGKRVQVHVFNSTGRQPVAAPACAEHLDVRERIDPALEALGAVGPLLARLCSAPDVLRRPAQANPSDLAKQQQQQQLQAQHLDLLAESNRVDLEYSFTAGRTQFLEPALAFLVSWTRVEPACGGELAVADSGAVSSPNFPDFYAAGAECRYLLRVPRGKRIRIQIGELTLLAAPRTGRSARACADSLTILDGAVGVDRPVLFQHCANGQPPAASLGMRASSAGDWAAGSGTGPAGSPSSPAHAPGQPQAPIVSSSSSVLVILSSQPESSVPLMRPKQRKGFYLTYASEPAIQGCGGLFSTKSAVVKSADYEPSPLWNLPNASPDELALAAEMARHFDSAAMAQGLPPAPADNANYYLFNSDFLAALRSARAQNSSSSSAVIAPEGPLQPNGNRATQSGSRAHQQQQQQPAGGGGGYRSRCEFEIRPADQARDHRIQLDWLEMPSELSVESSSLSRWARRARCARSRLLIFNANPSSPAAANESELATFCAGDKYNASLPQLAPIVSAGHVLYLVYESAQALPGGGGGGGGGEPETSSPAGGATSSNRQPTAGQLPAGFKLRYSTVCSAVYRQLEGRVQAELSPDVDECVYHIVLPPNNTISLVIDPSFSEAMLLPDGSCAAQAVFLDGALPRGKLALAQMERQLRTFSFSSAQSVEATYVGSIETGEAGAGSPAATRAGTEPAASADEQVVRLGSPLAAAAYWQYASNQAHDIKEFDVCKLPSLGIDSVWNHMSLLFKLNPKVRRREPDAAAAQQPAPRLQLAIRYKAEPACGGIISEPREGSIRLVAREPVPAANTAGGGGGAGFVGSPGGPSTPASEPLTMARYLRTSRHQACAWILRNKPGYQIQLSFDQVPVDEIRRRRGEWINWLRKEQLRVRQEARARAAKSGAAGGAGAAADLDYVLFAGETGGRSPGADSAAADEQQLDAEELERVVLRPNCSQAFQELIELYEPDLNRTQYICPTELLTDARRPLAHWTTQSDTVFVRLVNASEPAGGEQSSLVNEPDAPDAPTTTSEPSESQQQQTPVATPPAGSPGASAGANKTTVARIWPGRRPLQLNQPIRLNYFMLNERSRNRCGGKLIQSSGSLASPRHPFNYPPNSNCVWLIQAPEAHQQIRLNFTRFELEKQANCWFDYLELRNGPSESSPLIGRFCHRDLQGRQLISHSNSLWLRFHSDAHLNRAGFRLQFDSASTGCGGQLSAPSGQIDSPNYPLAFAHSADCEWTIEVSEANRIQLTIEDLDLGGAGSGSGAAPSANSAGKCRPAATTGPDADYLEIFDSGAPGTVAAGSLGKFCQLPLGAESGRREPVVLESSSNRLHLVYKSQALDDARGFRLSYTTKCAPIELTGLSGAIESPGYPDAYLPSSRCLYKLRAPLGSNLTLLITDLELEGEPSATGNRTVGAATLPPPPSPLGKLAKPRTCSTDSLKIWSLKARGADPFEAAKLASSSNSTLAASSVGISDELVALMRRVSSLRQFNRERNSTFASQANGSLAKQFELNLEQIYCSKLEQLSASERRPIELDTNQALVQFSSDQALEMRGFRLEWRARGCGAQLAPETSVGPLSFDERLNLTAWQTSRPFECLWTIDLSRLARSVELDLVSDMRALDGSPAPAASRAANQAPPEDEAQCAQSSLTIFDGPGEQAPVLARNCNQRRRQSNLFTSSSVVRVLFRSAVRLGSAGASLGRSFHLVGWPAHRDSCSQSLYELAAPFNTPAGVRKSPNYPELYDDSQAYKCSSLISSSSSGRLRFRIEELDIPVASAAVGDSGAPAAAAAASGTALGLIRDEKACKRAGNYLAIRSVASSDHPVNEVFCGKLNDDQDASDGNKRQPEVILEQQTAWLDFFSQPNSGAGAGGRWRVSFERLCGASIKHLNFVEEFSTPNYPGRPSWPSRAERAAAPAPPEASDSVCLWRLSAQGPAWSPADKGKRREAAFSKLHFSVINFVESDQLASSPSDCLRVYEGVELSLRQSHFNLSQLDREHKPKLKLCKQGDIKHSSLYYVSRGAQLLVLVSGNTIAKFQVKPYENYCGADFQLRQAEFATPDYPQPYGADLDCHYFISASPGSRIRLNFLEFNLPEPELDDESLAEGNKCDNVDHIEVRQLSATKRVQIRARSVFNENDTGEQRAANATTTSSIIKWFQAYQTEAQASLFREPLPGGGGGGGNAARPSQAVERLFELAKLHYLVVDGLGGPGSSMYQMPSKIRGQNARLAIRLNEFYSNSRLLGRFCGRSAPQLDSLQLQDELLVRFRSHGPRPGDAQTAAAPAGRAARGFLASFKVEQGGLVRLLDERALAGEDNLLASPGFPNPSRLNATVRWQLETAPTHVLQFDLISLELGGLSADCQDALDIFDGPNPASAARAAHYCGKLSYKSLLSQTMAASWLAALNGTLAPSRLPVHLAYDPLVGRSLLRPVRSSSNLATVVYENLAAEGAFLLRYKAVERRRAQSAAESLANYIEPLAGKPLEADELLLREHEPPLDLTGSASSSCSRLVQLSPKWASGSANATTSQVELVSPDWPHETRERQLECHWTLFTRENTNIQLIVDPAISLANNYAAGQQLDEPVGQQPGQSTPPGASKSSNCFHGERRNFIVVHDGASQLSPVLARHCLPAPPVQIQSSGRHLLVRYVHSEPRATSRAPETRPDLDEYRAGAPPLASTSLFKALARVGSCGGQYHVTSLTKVSSQIAAGAPGQSYANNLDCTYYVFAASPDQVLYLLATLSELNLAAKPTNAECTVGDYIELRDLPIQNERLEFNRALVGRSLGRFCAGRPPASFAQRIESPGSALAIQFRTDSENVGRGFALTFVSQPPRGSCPPSGQLVLYSGEPYGRLSSPNWPHGFPAKRRCKYNILAPPNQTIELTFVRYRRPSDFAASNASACADSFSYLADNEANSLIYDSRSLRESRAPVGGILLRQLVRDLPCKLNLGYSFYSDDTKNAALLGNGANRRPGANQPPAAPESLARITADEYQQLVASSAAPTAPLVVRTRSHVLALEYQSPARGLQANEGFLAALRLVDQVEGARCGGELAATPGRNLLESASFGRRMNDSEDFVQCDWTLRLDSASYNFADESKVSVDFTLVPSNSVGLFKTSYLVFQALEVPVAAARANTAAGFWLEEWSAADVERANDYCGLSRLFITDLYSSQGLFACGNLTGQRRFTLLSESPTTVTLRTKNLPLSRKSEKFAAEQQQQQQQSDDSLYRGLRAYFYESECPRVERLVGETLRIRSHADYLAPRINSSSPQAAANTTSADKTERHATNYSPGVCRWQIKLQPGHYRVAIGGLNLRRPKQTEASKRKLERKAQLSSTELCETSSSETPDLDYLEFRASSEPDSPVLARLCAHNQADSLREHKFELSSQGELSILFVAGLDRLMAGQTVGPFVEPADTDESLAADEPAPQQQLGFDLQLVRLKNATQDAYCQLSSASNVYQMVRNRDKTYYTFDFYTSHMVPHFLYPKNVHCEIDLRLTEELRFNLTFVDYFDLEPSRECQNDYVQVEELFEEAPLPAAKVATTTTAKPSGKRPPKATTSTTTTARPRSPFDEFQMEKYKLAKRLVGRWCGKSLPKGNFLTKSNIIRVTFHSNERVEGKGFILEWASSPAAPIAS